MGSLPLDGKFGEGICRKCRPVLTLGSERHCRAHSTTCLELWSTFARVDVHQLYAVDRACATLKDKVTRHCSLLPSRPPQHLETTFPRIQYLAVKCCREARGKV